MSVIVSVAVREPLAVGVNEIWRLQVLPPLTPDAQPFVIIEKSLLSVPDIERLLMVRVALPTFSSVTWV